MEHESDTSESNASSNGNDVKVKPAGAAGPNQPPLSGNFRPLDILNTELGKLGDMSKDAEAPSAQSPAPGPFRCRDGRRTRCCPRPHRVMQRIYRRSVDDSFEQGQQRHEQQMHLQEDRQIDELQRPIQAQPPAAQADEVGGQAIVPGAEQYEEAAELRDFFNEFEALTDEDD